MKTMSVKIGLMLMVVPVLAFGSTLESLQGTYSNSVAKIVLETKLQKDNALDQYRKSLEAILAMLREKGDISEGMLAVAAEQKRFEKEPTVPAVASHKYLDAVTRAYYKQVKESDDNDYAKRVTLLRQYVEALNRLLKDLVDLRKMEEALAVGKVRTKAADLLAQVDAASQKKTLEPEQKSVVGVWTHYHANGKIYLNPGDFIIHDDGQFEVKGNKPESGKWKYLNEERVKIERRSNDGSVTTVTYDKATDTMKQSNGPIYRRYISTNKTDTASK